MKPNQVRHEFKIRISATLYGKFFSDGVGEQGAIWRAERCMKEMVPKRFPDCAYVIGKVEPAKSPRYRVQVFLERVIVVSYVLGPDEDGKKKLLAYLPTLKQQYKKFEFKLLSYTRCGNDQPLFLI